MSCGPLGSFDNVQVCCEVTSLLPYRGSANLLCSVCVEETHGFTNRDDTFSAGKMTLLITRIHPQKIIQMGHMMIDHFISG